MSPYCAENQLQISTLAAVRMGWRDGVETRGPLNGESEREEKKKNSLCDLFSPSHLVVKEEAHFMLLLQDN